MNEFVPPHPATTLHCSKATTCTDLERFLKRVEKFTSMRYFIIGVDKLVYGVQDVLLKWVSTEIFYFLFSLFEIYLTMF